MNPLSILNSPGFDYVVPANPTVSVNPSKQWSTWLNSATGELFVCVDRTTNLNLWRGQRGTTPMPTDGLVAHWSFDNVIGTTVYDECGTYNGALVGGATAGSRTGHIGKALNCDGVDDRMTFGALGIFGNDFTFAGWFCFDKEYGALSDTEFLFHPRAEKDISLYRELDGTLFWGGYDSSAFGIVSVEKPIAGEWFHIAGRWSMGSSLDLFINGTKEGTLSTSRMPSATTSISAIGYQATTTPKRYFDGAADECRIYNRAVTDGEISLLYREAI